jgi:hypothetical protein
VHDHRARLRSYEIVADLFIRPQAIPAPAAVPLP